MVKLWIVLVGAGALATAACAGDDSTSDTGSGGVAGSGGNPVGPVGSGGAGASGASGGFGAVGDGGAGGTTGGAGTGGQATTGGAGGGPSAVPECVDDADCTMVNDCCSCIAIPTTRQPPVCNVPECFAPTCTSLGNPSAMAACVVGHCTAGFVCDHALVLCDSVEPVCPDGQTASVVGTCWGQCVDATECATVAECGQCGAMQACVTEVTQLGLLRHCVQLPGECGGAPTCACLGPAVCLAPFDTCSTSGEGLSCSCPSC
jgi:hypothetical protein